MKCYIPTQKCFTWKTLNNTFKKQDGKRDRLLALSGVRENAKMYNYQTRGIE